RGSRHRRARLHRLRPDPGLDRKGRLAGVEVERPGDLRRGGDLERPGHVCHPLRSPRPARPPEPGTVSSPSQPSRMAFLWHRIDNAGLRSYYMLAIRFLQGGTNYETDTCD